MNNVHGKLFLVFDARLFRHIAVPNQDKSQMLTSNTTSSSSYPKRIGNRDCRLARSRKRQAAQHGAPTPVSARPNSRWVVACGAASLRRWCCAPPRAPSPQTPSLWTTSSSRQCRSRAAVAPDCTACPRRACRDLRTRSGAPRQQPSRRFATRGAPQPVEGEINPGAFTERMCDECGGSWSEGGCHQKRR